MGLNINVRKIGNDYHRTKSVRFDGCRYVGDEEYIWADDLEWKHLKCPNNAKGIHCCGAQYRRPKDFSKHREWITTNLEEWAHERFFKIFDKMEKDSEIYFDLSI